MSLAVYQKQGVPNGVHIIGVGARTPLGACATSSAAAVRAGISMYGKLRRPIDSPGERMSVVKISYMPEETDGVDRYFAMAEPALFEALAPIRELTESPIPLFLGLPPERPGRPEGLPEYLVQRLEMTKCSPQIREVFTFASGHASGLIALKAGCELIQSGRCEFCTVGGVDSYLEFETLKWLESNNQLHQAGYLRKAWGFTPGEAAGFCLLGSDSAVKRYGLDSLSQVISVATAQEKNLIKTDTVCIGAGLSESFRTALKEVPPSVKINHLICDQNGEIYRANEFGFTLARTAERFAEGGNFFAPAQFWGDVGAASGPLFAILAIAAAHKGYAKGPHTLMSTSSEGGERAAAILHTAIRIRER